MPQLVNGRGQPISSADYAKKKKDRSAHPLMGELANAWAGDAVIRNRWQPNVLQYDTSQLTHRHYREMADHYQVNSSITVLSFMLHQMEWKIDCDNLKIAKHCEENMRRIWTRLVRAFSQAFIFGYSPNGLRWENGENDKTWVTKILDFRPEDCRVNWKEVTGVAQKTSGGQSQSRKVKIFNGIDHDGQPTIPVSNSLWYPLMMQNGDYYGKKLLNAAFTPWYFSNLVHMYTNRYHERFGEPTIVGRAPFDEEKEINGQTFTGNEIMNNLMGLVRSGSHVTLPNDRAQNGIDGVTNYDYQMEFMESMQRGADFDRYLTRLDQEISLALFTPLLMMNTADGGSFNLGVVHTQMYQAMIRAIADDWKEYIDRYLLRPMAQINFGPNAKLPQIRFQKIGKVSEETGRALLNQLMTTGNDGHSVKVDLVEASAALGLTLEAGAILAQPPSKDGSNEDPATDDSGAPKKQKDTRKGRPEREGKAKGIDKKGAQLANSIADRLAGQFSKAFREDVKPEEFAPNIGYTSQVGALLGDAASDFYSLAEAWTGSYYSIFTSQDEPLESEMRNVLRTGLTAQLERLEHAT